MSDRQSNSEDEKPGVALTIRQPWVRPTLMIMAASDAEIGTRNVTGDGQFSVTS
jgi:hypothetical protein